MSILETFLMFLFGAILGNLAFHFGGWGGLGVLLLGEIFVAFFPKLSERVL